MTYTPDQILAAIHSGDAGLARYYLSTLKAAELRELALTLGERVEAAPESDDGADLVAEALTHVVRKFHTTPDQVLSTSKRREDVEARQVVAYVAHLHDMPYAAIGRRIGRDHTTVMHAVVRVGESPRLRRIATSIAESTGWDRERDVA